MIELKKIYKKYQVGDAESQILKNINLKIEEGEFTAIMGPSGSGKTTMMNILGMLDTPTSGQYIFNGKNISSLSGDELAEIRLKNIGFIFQSFNLLKRSTVMRNVIMPFIYAEKPNGNAEREKKAAMALKKVGLGQEKLWDHLSNQLSGGQMQRVAIARALINNPDVLLADEPTGNLDSKSGYEIMNLFIDLNKQGHTVVMITHSEEIAQLAHRVIQIKDGEIIKDYRN
ncbi:MAG: ABC transporter ATP-binding protein [Patescibacteria group bacterium]|jgi:putative ABC transport system ATP-binding protein